LKDIWSHDSQQAGAADSDEANTMCTDHWKAAMSDSLKQMWLIYHETGIFTSVCRHGFIWWIVNMIESREL